MSNTGRRSTSEAHPVPINTGHDERRVALGGSAVSVDTSSDSVGTSGEKKKGVDDATASPVGRRAPSFILIDTPPSDFLCPICSELWKNPLELVPCGHIFCRKCIAIADYHNGPNGQVPCPVCRAQRKAHKPPNRILQNLVSDLKCRCAVCDWVGSQEESKEHIRCGVYWDTLGRSMDIEDSKVVNDKTYDRIMCFTKAISLEPSTTLFWHNLGMALRKAHGAVTITGLEEEGESNDEDEGNGPREKGTDGQSLLKLEPVQAAQTAAQGTCVRHQYDAKACFVRVLELDDPDYQTGLVGGRQQSEDRCDFSPFYIAATWYKLGTILAPKETVEVHLVEYSKPACFLRALELNHDDPMTWKALGQALQAEDEGGKETAEEAAAKEKLEGDDGQESDEANDSTTSSSNASSSNPRQRERRGQRSNARTTTTPSTPLVVSFNRGTYDSKACYLRAILLDPCGDSECWFLLGRALLSSTQESAASQRRGVFVKGTTYDWKGCLSRAIALVPPQDDKKASQLWFEVANLLLVADGGYGNEESSQPHPQESTVRSPHSTIRFEGKNYNGKQCCCKALESDPTNEKAREALGRLLSLGEVVTIGGIEHKSTSKRSTAAATTTASTKSERSSSIASSTSTSSSKMPVDPEDEGREGKLINGAGARDVSHYTDGAGARDVSHYTDDAAESSSTAEADIVSSSTTENASSSGPGVAGTASVGTATDE